MDNQLVPIDNLKSNAIKIFDYLDISQNTKTDYIYRIGLFLDYLKQYGLTRNSYLDFKKRLASRNDITVATKNKYLIVAKIFLKELHRQGLLPTDITFNVKVFTQNKKHKKMGLSEDEVILLSNKIHQLPNDCKTTRVKAILCLLTLQGLRQIEIVQLDVKDIDLVSQTALVQSKGQDDKEAINLLPETTGALKVYMSTNKIADGALFVSQSNHGKDQRLTTRGLRNIVKGILTELEINKTVHGFRHYFTTKLVKAYKGDLLTVAQYTRHKSLEMLQVYNDSIKGKEDLPKLYETFSNVKF